MTASEEHVRRHRDMIDAFNHLDFDRMVESYSEDATATDHAQQMTRHGPDRTREANEAWVEAFPDAMIEVLDCFGIGDWTVMRFVGRGTNFDRFAGFGPTNERAEIEFCQLLRWEDDRIMEDHLYYDLYGMLSQLGHVPEMATAT